MPKPLPRLERWFFPANDYQAPELRVPHVAGEIYGHANQQRFPDGKLIQTSAVVGCRRGVVRTRKGSRYRLGEPKPEYAAFMRENYPGWDPADPMNVPGKERPDG